MTATSMVCSCGDPSDHVISRRHAADGTTVELWSTGVLTYSLGFYVPGTSKPKTPEQRHRALTVGRLVLGDVELYDSSDLRELVAAARFAVDRGDRTPGAMRKRFAAVRDRQQRLRPTWKVEQCDRDGNVVEKSWILPRLLLPGYAVLWRAGTYSILHKRLTKTTALVLAKGDVYDPPGLTFTSFADVDRYLRSEIDANR